jgi:FkbM family methyltransferase
MAILRALPQLLYRKGRSAAFSLVGRNPLCRGKRAMTWSEDWASVLGLAKAYRFKPELLESEPGGRTRWSSSLGPFWVPKDCGPEFISFLQAEMMANVYPISYQASDRPCFLDCGGNIGMFTRCALQRGAARVVAFEPSPENVACYRMNFKREIKEGRVTLVEKGVWDSNETLSFSSTNTLNPGSHHIVEKGPGNIEIPVSTIDEMCRELNLPKVDYIKMDVEGAETRALKGAAETIRAFRPRLCVVAEHTSDLYANALAVVRLIEELGGGEYEYLCTEAHPTNSTVHGSMLTPYSMLFYRAGER